MRTISMARAIHSLVIAALLTLSHRGAAAQVTPLDGAWSLLLSFNYNHPVASSMRGNGDELRLDILGNPTFTTARYPFGDTSTTGFGWGGNLAYRFPESGWSAIGGIDMVTFVSRDSTGQRARLVVETFSVGGEYALGGPSAFWNPFARVRVNGSMIGGDIRYVDSVQLPPPFDAFTYAVDVRTEVPPELRFGLGMEFGARVNIPDLPISVEGVANYTNTNLLGKSYVDPERTASSGLPERALNDGANPQDPSDQPRTIDFLSLRIGIRTWF